MKTISLGLPIAAAMLFLAPGLRADATSTASTPATTQSSPSDERRAEWIKRFDKNGDGQLDAEERAAARAAMKEQRSEKAERRHEFALRRYDKNGDGVLDESERTAAVNDMASRPRFIKRFDKDGDGKLSPEEISAAKESLAERWAKESAAASSAQPAPSAQTSSSAPTH
ncbi:MAG TPA: EF-hand domain-containing protein [Opitutaceae bacterium]|nr:EF-hand domain-containing protein [Opitutaceae bacterium]